MKKRGVVVVAAIAAVVVSSAGAVRADDADAAQRAFEQGTAAFEHKDFAAAARHFERAFVLVPRGAAMLNAGLSWDAAGDRPRAADALTVALGRADLRPAEAARAQTRLDELRAHLGVVDIAAPAGGRVKVAHVDGAVVPVRVHLAPGSYRVEIVTADGMVDATVHVEPGRERRLALDAPSPPRAHTSTPAAEGDASSTIPLGLVLVGTAFAFAGAAVFLGLEALSARDAFVESDYTDANARDRAATARLFTNVSWGAAAVAGVAGAVLIVTSPRAKGTNVQGVAGAGSVGLRVRF